MLVTYLQSEKGQWKGSMEFVSVLFVICANCFTHTLPPLVKRGNYLSLLFELPPPFLS